MDSRNDTSDRGPVCDCRFRCIDVATGVLMARDGLTADHAHDALLRTAERRSVSLHVWARDVIDHAVSRHRVATASAHT